MVTMRCRTDRRQARGRAVMHPLQGGGGSFYVLASMFCDPIWGRGAAQCACDCAWPWGVVRRTTLTSHHTYTTSAMSVSTRVTSSVV